MENKLHTLSLEEKHYIPQNVEDTIYENWKRTGVFSCNPKSSKPPFSIVIPPPNVTGRLHMGHALNNSIQDCLSRFKRMDGFDVLWVPGTDHAGISTQSVVKKHLDAEGINFRTLGREKVIERIWEWKNKYGNQILLQLEKLGASCDWSRLRFTMDESLSRAVRVAFKKLYDQGLIYRGKYIVNWCPVDQTALSDDEVDTKEGGEPGFLWHIRYPISGSGEFLTIATTRPETMLGDVAVAVNPKDERYQHLIGKMVTLPLCNREIPIIADDYVDRSFGTGCLKITPAHDPNDFQIGLRHGLPQIDIMNDDASINDEAPVAYRGLDRFECREKIITDLKAMGLIAHIEERMTPVGRAERSKAIIEYRLSDQWFVKMTPLAEKALEASDRGDITLLPERWDKVYRHWLENTRDWCISRQIWWGHQIPAWYHKETGEILVDSETPKEVLAHPEQWQQEEDVLDTWFSSALWPYSTMGWPDTTDDLKKYYPTSVLTTAKDIIYFWVARMVMTGLNFMDNVPFKTVYFHPVICDARGETMSKSKGNGIDPLHVIKGAHVTELEGPILDARPANMEELLLELHRNYPNGFSAVGADALRITLFSLNSQSQQVQLSLQKFDEVGRRFTDKLWNASRFVLSKLRNSKILPYNQSELSLEDKWIIGRLDNCVSEVRTALDGYRFHEAVNSLLHFFWDDFCDWYLELSKDVVKNEGSRDAEIKRAVLAEVFAQTLKLLHPFVPFITEELWAHLQDELGENNKIAEIDNSILALSSFPRDRNRYNQKAQEDFQKLQEIVKKLRNVRSELGIAAHKPVPVVWNSHNENMHSLVYENSSLIIHAASLRSFEASGSKPPGFISAVMNELELYIDLSGSIDIQAEIARNKKQILKYEKEALGISARLNNPRFIEKAPQNVREETEIQLATLKEKIDRITQVINDLQG
jgi:valyl-tRNA synthetase